MLDSASAETPRLQVSNDAPRRQIFGLLFLSDIIKISLKTCLAPLVKAR